MKIEILGSGCKKCTTLYDAVNEIVAAKNIDAEVLKVEDLKTILGYGVMQTPALVVDGVVKFKGSVPKKDKIEKLITE